MDHNGNIDINLNLCLIFLKDVVRLCFSCWVLVCEKWTQMVLLPLKVAEPYRTSEHVVPSFLNLKFKII